MNYTLVSGYHLANGQEITTTDPNSLVNCTSDTSCTTKPEAQAAIGYYKYNADPTQYIQCTGSACAIDETSYAACTSGKVGLLDDNGKLCVDTTPAHAAEFAADSTPVYYIVSYDATSSSNIFYDKTADGTKYASVVATELSITLNQSKAAACYKNNKESSEATSDACTEASGTYLECTSGECTAPAA